MSLGPRKANALRVLFVSGEARETDGSRVVRCVYQARQIELAGGRANVAFVGDVAQQSVDQYNVVVLSRCAFKADAVAVVRAARRNRALLLADLDDRIFCPWDVGITGALRSRALLARDADLEQRSQLRQRDFLRILPAVDGIIVSTPGLVDELAALGLRGHVVRNALDTQRHVPIARPRTALRKLLFMTGTQTHDADFLVLAPPLRTFLLRHPDVSLCVLGPVALPSALRGLPNVKTQAKIPIEQLYRFVAEFDVCLVPLEATTFNDSKSAIKFIECGSVSVPVIASPRREYRALIEHGRNGLLAADGPGFQAALEQLYAQPERLAQLAVAAHETVLREHTVASRAALLADTLLHIEAQRTAVPARPLPCWIGAGAAQS